jgi:gas vesicle protein GvpG
VDFVTLPFRLPFLPLTGLVRLAEMIRDEAERQENDPQAIREELEQLAHAREAGELPPDEISQREREAVARLLDMQR